MSDDQPQTTLAEFEFLQTKLAELLINPILIDGAERRSIVSGLAHIDEKVVGMRAMIAAVTGPTFKDCA